MNDEIRRLDAIIYDDSRDTPEDTNSGKYRQEQLYQEFYKNDLAYEEFNILLTAMKRSGDVVVKPNDQTLWLRSKTPQRGSQQNSIRAPLTQPDEQTLRS